MNILFITSEMFNKTGGGTLARTYLVVLKSMAGQDNVYPFIFPKRNLPEEESYKGYITKKHYSSLEKISNVFLRKDPLIGVNVEKELVKCIKKNRIDSVLLFRSTQGYLIKVIHKFYPSMPIITVYHDIFPDVVQIRKRENLIKFWSKFPIYSAYKKSEKYSTENSSANIVFNNRERTQFIKYYNREPNLVLPIVWKDTFDPSMVRNVENENLILLFVGQYFGPNVNGLRWFAREVIPHVDNNVELWVVGRKMEVLKDDSDFQNKKIKIIGTVDSLGEYYYKADVIVAPILEGTGMKTKTAEALMFGKTMLASAEAMTGYDYLTDMVCNNAEDYIYRINLYVKNHPKGFNNDLRKMYEENHSVAQAAKKMKLLFDEFA